MNTAISFFTLLFSTSMLMIFNVSFYGGRINRIISEIPHEIVKTSILIDLEIDYNCVYFVKNVLETNVKTYYDVFLKDYTESYKISFFYYIENDDGTYQIDLSSYPRNAQIHVKAKYFLNYEIERYLTFSLGDIY